MSGSQGISKISVHASRTLRNKTFGWFWNSPSVCEHEQGNIGSSETSGTIIKYKCEPHGNKDLPMKPIPMNDRHPWAFVWKIDAEWFFLPILLCHSKHLSAMRR
jgi:hypothetical protein